MSNVDDLNLVLLEDEFEEKFTFSLMEISGLRLEIFVNCGSDILSEEISFPLPESGESLEESG